MMSAVGRKRKNSRKGNDVCSDPDSRSVSGHPDGQLGAKIGHLSRCRSACGYARRCPTHSESHNAMQQVGVREAEMLSCRRKLFALGNFGIGIRFKEIWSAVGREPKVYARISIKLQYLVDA